MFSRRGESSRERALLRIVDRQERQIADLIDRIMFLTGRPWNVAPADLIPAEETEEEGRVLVSALDVLPEEWS